MKYLKLKNTLNTKDMKLQFISPVCLVLAGMAFFYSYIYFKNWNAPILASVCFSGGFFAILVALFNKKIMSYYFTANLSVFLFFIVMTVMAIYAGGIQSNSIWWLGTVPLIATFLLNSGFGLVWFIITLIDFYFVLFLGRNNFLPPNVLAGSDFESRFILSFIMNSSLIFTLCALIDLIGEKAQVEKEQMKLKALQLRQITSLGKLAAGVSHEINNPLTVLKGYQSRITRMLETGNELDRELIELYTEKINTSIQRIQLVTSLMRTISEQDGNRELIRFNLKDVINEILRMQREVISKKSIQVKVFLPDEELSFHGVYTEIFQAFFNVIEFLTSEETKKSAQRDLTVRMIADEKNYFFIIEDNCIFLSKEKRESIFEPFAKDYADIGKGLGLSFSLNAFHNNGGALQLDDSTQEGVAFRIAIPRPVTSIENF